MMPDDAVAVSATFHSPQGGLRASSLYIHTHRSALLAAQHVVTLYICIGCELSTERIVRTISSLGGPCRINKRMACRRIMMSSVFVLFCKRTRSRGPPEILREEAVRTPPAKRDVRICYITT